MPCRIRKNHRTPFENEFLEYGFFLESLVPKIASLGRTYHVYPFAAGRRLRGAAAGKEASDLGSAKHSQWRWPKTSTSMAEDPQVGSWEDIDRIDVRPGKGMCKVQSKNRWEIQIDLETGSVLSANYRRSDFIESLHDGSFFSDTAKLWLFLPNGLILLGLWFTGVYLWWLPIGVKRRKRRARLEKDK